MSPNGSTLNPARSRASHLSGCARAIAWNADADIRRAIEMGLLNCIRSLSSVGILSLYSTTHHNGQYLPLLYVPIDRPDRRTCRCIGSGCTLAEARLFQGAAHVSHPLSKTLNCSFGSHLHVRLLCTMVTAIPASYISSATSWPILSSEHHQRDPAPGINSPVLAVPTTIPDFPSHFVADR
jgi:hypothetical protein